MLFLVFHLGKDRYGLASRRIERVLPLLECKRIPRAPPYVAGLANYHGKPVPVLDLAQLACGTPAAEHLDTRLVLVRYQGSDNVAPELLGLIAERVTGIERVAESAFCDTGIETKPDAPYLGKVAAASGMLQLVEVDHLLTEEVRALLFPPRGQPC